MYSETTDVNMVGLFQSTCNYIYYYANYQYECLDGHIDRTEARRFEKGHSCK